MSNMVIEDNLFTDGAHSVLRLDDGVGLVANRNVVLVLNMLFPEIPVLITPYFREMEDAKSRVCSVLGKITTRLSPTT